jgi:hypothetical protein
VNFVAECKQCGVIERGELRGVADAAEDHEQFHDVKIHDVKISREAQLRHQQTRDRRVEPW